MKDNLNIENLFKEKFENFQPDVNPNLWANIQAGIGSTAAVTTGISVAVKVGLISGGIIAASIATWYFGFYEPNENQANIPQNNTISLVDNKQNESDINADESIIVVNDINDPVIINNQANIERELRKTQPVVSNNTITNSNQINSNNTNSVNTNNNVSTNTNDVNNVNNNTSNDVVTTSDTQVDKIKPTIPTGRMEFSQTGVYAPSVVAFKSNAVNQKNVKWQFGDATFSEGVEVKHTYTKPGTYVVKMTVIGEQSNYEESQEIVVKSKSSIDNIPNVITPNGDRINDFFSVTTTDIQSFFISIRDKQGNEIYSSNDKDFVWDGTDFEGNVLEKGIYTYYIIAEGKDGGVFKLPGQLYLQ